MANIRLPLSLQHLMQAWQGARPRSFQTIPHAVPAGFEGPQMPPITHLLPDPGPRGPQAEMMRAPNRALREGPEGGLIQQRMALQQALADNQPALVMRGSTIDRPAELELQNALRLSQILRDIKQQGGFPAGPSGRTPSGAGEFAVRDPLTGEIGPESWDSTLGESTDSILRAGEMFPTDGTQYSLDELFKGRQYAPSYEAELLKIALETEGLPSARPWAKTGIAEGPVEPNLRQQRLPFADWPDYELTPKAAAEGFESVGTGENAKELKMTKTGYRNSFPVSLKEARRERKVRLRGPGGGTGAKAGDFPRVPKRKGRS